MTSVTVALAASLLVLAISAIVAHRLLLSPLAKFPGPRLWALTRFPYMLAYRRGALAHKLRGFHRRYGEVIRVAPNELSFIRPDAIREIYAKRPNPSFRTLPKDPVRQPLPRPGAPVSILEGNDADHARIRKGWSASFSNASLSAQEPLFNGYVDLLIQKLTEKSKGGKSVDLQQWYSFCTFDIITSLSFGEDLQCTELGRYHDWVSLLVFSIKGRVQMAACRYYPALYSLLMMIMSEKAKKMLAKHLAFTKEKVTRRLNTQASHPDFFANLHRTKMSEAEVAINAATMIFAGSHTLQSTLTGITLHLLNNPGVLSKVTEEVRRRFSSEKEITFRSLQSLPYLDAVFQEEIRLTSPVPLGLTRMIPKGGSVICGFPLPAGTIVSYQMWAANTSPTNFNRPQEFHPERFDKASPPVEFQRDNMEAMQPFLAGPRDCIGRNLAQLEVLLILGRMLYHFDMARVTGNTPWEEQETYAVWMRSPLMATLAVRQ